MISNVLDDAEAALARLLKPAPTDDPYPLYDAVRSAGRVYRSSYGMWVVTGLTEVTRALREPRLQHAVTTTRYRDRWEHHESLRQMFRWLVNLSGPDHTRLRSLVNKAFTPATVARLKPSIERLTGRLLDDVEQQASAGRPVDIMEAVAFPLPLTVIGDLLGLPATDGPLLRRLAAEWTKVIDENFSDDELATADTAAREMRYYFAGVLRERRRRPRPDLISALAAVEGAEGKLDEDELITMAMFLFVAGFETTTSLIGHGLYALLRHPVQQRLWRSGNISDTTAVEELIRYCPPLHTVGRVATSDVELEGAGIPAGEFVLIAVAAANRDPIRYTAPHQLDLGRDAPGHASFGAGSHYCMGAGLARLEAETFFPAFLRRFPSVELVGTPLHRVSLGPRGLDQLPLALRTTR